MHVRGNLCQVIGLMLMIAITAQIGQLLYRVNGLVKKKKRALIKTFKIANPVIIKMESFTLHGYY